MSSILVTRSLFFVTVHLKLFINAKPLTAAKNKNVNHTVDDLLQVLQLGEALVGEAAVVPLQNLADLLPDLVLHVLVLAQLVYGEVHGGRGRVEACDEEQEDLGHLGGRNVDIVKVGIERVT